MIDILWKGTDGEIFRILLKMTDTDAQAFFSEYIDYGEHRLELLIRTYCETGGRTKVIWISRRRVCCLFGCGLKTACIHANLPVRS